MNSVYIQIVVIGEFKITFEFDQYWHNSGFVHDSIILLKSID